MTDVAGGSKQRRMTGDDRNTKVYYKKPKTFQGKSDFEENSDYEENQKLYSSKKATVEVTVKVKKRRIKDKDCVDYNPNTRADNVFRKGSWGDLLSNNRVEEIKKPSIEAQIKKSSLKKDDKKSDVVKVTIDDKGKCSSPASAGHCRRIPLSDELYLETHTHVLRENREKPSRPPRKEVVKESTSKSTDRLFEWQQLISQKYEVQNEYLRNEIERLRLDVERVKLESKRQVQCRSPSITNVNSSFIKPKVVEIKSKSREQLAKKRETKQTMTSASTLNIAPLVEKRSGVAQTTEYVSDISSKTNTSMINIPSSSSTSNHQIRSRDEVDDKDFKLRQENEALRSEAAGLLNEMEKARKENQESIMTIRELYQLAELLKKENQELIGAQEQQQFLQEKLVQAITENQELKRYLDSMMQKQKQAVNQNDDQMDKIRNVIEEVKSTIQGEIEEITKNKSVFRSQSRELLRSSGFLDISKLSEGYEELSGLNFNDTNASEIQKIFGTTSQKDQSQSSDILEDDPLGHIKAFLKSSAKRTSTPASSRSSSRTSHKDSQQDLVESFTRDVSRSFKPIQKELMNETSSTSTPASEYRSTNSTPTV